MHCSPQWKTASGLNENKFSKGILEEGESQTSVDGVMDNEWMR